MKREAEAMRVKLLLVFGILLIVVGAVFQQFFLRSIYKVKATDVLFQGSDGRYISAKEYKPKEASASNQLSTVVLMAGEYSNKDFLDNTAMELSRRGNIVFAVDDEGLGDSQIRRDPSAVNNITESVRYLTNLSYVDKTRIGVIGFEKSAVDKINEAILVDNTREQMLIKSCLLIAGDPLYYNEKGMWSNEYMMRDVGAVAMSLDDLSMRGETTDPAQTWLVSEYPHSSQALSFLNFGRNPSTLPANANTETNTIYRLSDRDSGSIRILYTSKGTRNIVYYSPFVMKNIIDYTNLSLSPSKPLPNFNQLWYVKSIFSLVEMLGFIISVMALCVFLTTTQYFADVSLLSDTNDESIVAPMVVSKGDVKSKLWFWLLSVAYIAVSTCIYPKIAGFAYTANFIREKQPFAFSLWGLCNSVFIILVAFFWFRDYAKKRNYNPVRSGILMPKIVVLKTIALSLLVCLISYLFVFLPKYFLDSSYRIASVSFSTFKVSRFVMMVWPYVWPNLLFFLCLSILQNVMLYCSIGWFLNGFITALVSSMSCIIIILAQFISSLRGRPLMFGVNVPYNQFVLWMLPTLGIIFITSITGRYIYKRTKNVFLPGLVNAMIATAMIISGTKIFY